jgi:hypothetical protein
MYIICICLIMQSWLWSWFTEVLHDTRQTTGFIRVKVCAHQCVKRWQSYLNLYKLGGSVTRMCSLGKHQICPGSLEVIENKLGLLAGARLVRQKQRRYIPEKWAAIRDEINQLLKAGFIWEVPFPEWLPNPVMVKKPNGTWRMYVCWHQFWLYPKCVKIYIPYQIK